MKKFSLMLFIFFNLLSSSALACGCIGQTDLAEELETSTLVFSGKVIAEKFVPVVENIRGVEIKADALIYKFAVDKWWKGNNAAEVIFPVAVRKYADGTGYLGSNCVHISFKVGERYLVYAIGEKDKLQALVCGRTKPIQKAEEDIKQLEKLRAEASTAPLKNAPVSQDSQNSNNINLTDEDRAEILNQVLNNGLVEQKLFDAHLLLNPIVVSTKNIKKEFALKLDGYKFELLSPEEIEEKAEKEGAFLFLSFPIFKIEGKKVEVVLLNARAGKLNQWKYQSVGGALRYEFSKESGKWISEIISRIVP
jgi:hypothetical protein